MVTYRRWLLIRINPKEVLWKLWRSWHIFEKNYVAQYLSDIKKIMCDFLRCTLTSLSWWKCACKGRREGGNRLRLPSVPFSWSLVVHSQSLASTLQKTKYLRRRLVLVPCCHLEFFVYHKLLIISPPFIGPSTWKQKNISDCKPSPPPKYKPPSSLS